MDFEVADRQVEVPKERVNMVYHTDYQESEKIQVTPNNSIRAGGRRDRH